MMWTIWIGGSELNAASAHPASKWVNWPSHNLLVTGTDRKALAPKIICFQLILISLGGHIFGIMLADTAIGTEAPKFDFPYKGAWVAPYTL